MILADLNYSEVVSTSGYHEQLQAHIENNGNPNVLVSAFTIYLRQIDRHRHATAPVIVLTPLINQGNS